MKLDGREIPGGPDSVAEAPDIIEILRFNRDRVTKRKCAEVEASKRSISRRKRQNTGVPTPQSIQNSAQSSTQQLSQQSFTIYEDIAVEATLNPMTERPESSKKAAKSKQEQGWESTYNNLKRQSSETARDYLVNLVGHDEFPEPRKVPTMPPEVLIDEEFDLSDLLKIWRRFITDEIISHITKATNQNAAQLRRQ